MHDSLMFHPWIINVSSMNHECFMHDHGWFINDSCMEKYHLPWTMDGLSMVHRWISTIHPCFIQDPSVLLRLLFLLLTSFLTWVKSIQKVTLKFARLQRYLWSKMPMRIASKRRKRIKCQAFQIQLKWKYLNMITHLKHEHTGQRGK